jgi:PPOX class probable F420-dependent enzyme
MRERARQTRVGRLATVRRDGRPHLVVCCFGLDGDTMYSAVDDKPKTTPWLQRLRNVASNSAASFLVDYYDEDWTALWWIRLDGAARIITSGTEYEHAIALLCDKYEQYRTQPPTGAVIAIDITNWTAWP